VSLIGFAVAAGLGNVVGALAVVRQSDRSLHAIDAGIAFGAGFMLAVTLIGVFPVALYESPGAAWFVLAGYLTVHVAQHVVNPHFHYGQETHRVSPATGLTALVGLSLHTFFDGVAIASGFLASNRLGLLLFLAVLVHKLPEGVTIASMMLAGGQSKSRAIASAVGLGLATLLGAVLTESVGPLARHGLALSAGVTLYVAASNLVPEFQNRRRWQSAVWFLGGVGSFFAAEWLIGGSAF
jgi:ZIP family zinc transporter/zinc and cadmium transporter